MRKGWRCLIGGGALVAGAACASVTDSLLEAIDPDLINPENAASAEGALAVYNGALVRFTLMTAGQESTWLFGGLLADEWSSSSTFVQNDETDQRAVQENNASVTGMMYRINRTRTAANQGIALLQKYRPDRRVEVAELYFARGFAELQLAMDFCSGIPLSDGSTEQLVLGKPLTTAEVLSTAAASLDSALSAGGGAASSSTLVHAIRVARARVLVEQGQFDAAAALVTSVPTSYAYQHTFTQASTINAIWSQGLSQRRYTVGDSLEGNGRNLLVRNAVPFGSARDPRVPVVDTRTPGQDGATLARTTTLYDQTTPIDVVNGIDARLIEAEAALRRGNAAQWLAIHNALRAAAPQVGSVRPTGLGALTDPGTQDARISLHFREKAFWTFSRGQRLGDLRRLVRQYGRAPDAVFPVGTHYKGGNYGGDMNLPVVTDERNNPNFVGCLDRKA